MTSVPAQNPSRAGQPRREDRKRTVLPGKVVYNHGAFSFDCTIRNLSAVGARIDVPPVQIAPSHFHLIDLKNGMVHDAEVMWIASSQRGLRFIRSYPIEGVLPPGREFLKRMWNNSGARS